jgi:MFS transporter, DHA1 family, multidrug resistance protein B
MQEICRYLLFYSFTKNGQGEVCMKFSEFSRAIKIRILEIFVSRFTSGMIFPFMAIYLAYHFGAKLTGILLVSNVVIGVIANIYGGHYADRHGRKKIMAFSEVLRTFAFITMALANSPWFESAWVTFAMMTVNSICAGLAGPASYSMLIDISTQEQRKLLFSLRYWATNLSIAVGGIVGGLFFKSHLFELLTVLSLSTIFTMILIVFFINESYIPSIEKQQERFSLMQIFNGYREVIRDKVFVLFVLASTLVLSMELQLTGYIGIRLSQEIESQQFLSWKIDGVQMLGFLRTENTILVVFTSFLFVRLIQNFKDRNVLIIGTGLFVFGYSVLSISNNVYLLLIMMIVITIGEVTRIPVEQSYQAILPPEHSRSSYVALGSLAFNIAAIISSLTVTLAAFVPSSIVATMITIIGISGWLILLLIMPQLEKRRETENTVVQTKGA